MDFNAEKDEHAKKFERLQGAAEEGGPLSMEAFAEDWNESQFWVREVLFRGNGINSPPVTPRGRRSKALQSRDGAVQYCSINVLTMKIHSIRTRRRMSSRTSYWMGQALQ
jgi:hypothetical protein